ncbi:hypothetical protein NLG97_g6736 [Lecanicillium saksenae]|uniref:Uncharacterized protein n=1 Tax=Lecanicillium saksenae TaxID=468837 RepID=A0ACC1QRZ4_9HYPO|nr:hypothetical protein NLG97_g6736 [Lecanicillium saksenae]
MAVSMKRRLRRHKDAPTVLAPRIRILLARVHLDSFDSLSDEEYERSSGTSTATQADRRLEDDEGHERVLRERRRRHFTRLCVEQLYRFEEA